jgi:DNA repair exonuclease SbcCD nuclease subunit
MMEAIRILHTSDIHIGAPFEFLGARGEEQRRTVRETFERVTRLARERRYDLLIVAGDLFDRAYAVSERDTAFVLKCLADIGSGCGIVVLPGSHDYWGPGSVYERERSRFEAAGVSLLTPERMTAAFPGASLAVHGTAPTSPHESANLVSRLEPDHAMQWNVAVAHGSVAGASAAGEPEENPIRLDELRPGFDLLVLGHWHSYRVIRTEAPPVVYSGAPELIARDQTGAGSVASVTLSAAGASIERVAVGTRHTARAAVECTGCATTEELVARIMRDVPADMNLVLELSLSGVIGGDAVIDIDLALEMLHESYFSVRSSGGRPTRETARDELLAVPEETVAGSFVRLLLERIDRADGEHERDRLEEALQIGYQLFRGRNLLR